MVSAKIYYKYIKHIDIDLFGDKNIYIEIILKDGSWYFLKNNETTTKILVEKYKIWKIAEITNYCSDLSSKLETINDIEIEEEE